MNETQEPYEAYEPDVIAHGEADLMARPHGGDTHQPAAHPASPLSVPVHVAGQPFSGGHQGSHFTMVLSTGTNPVDQILGRDYDRVSAQLLSVDEDIVIAQSRELAESANNQVASVPTPSGAYIPKGLWVSIGHCDQVWAAATSATPTRVSVIVSRRLAVEHPAGP